MKLLIYADFPYWGGAPFALLRIARGLSKHRFKVWIMGRLDRRIYASLKRDPSIEAALPVEGKDIRPYLTKVNQLRVDAILGSSLQPSLGAARLALELNRPLVWRLMGHPKFWGINASPLKSAAVENIIKTIGLFSDEIITVSDFLKTFVVAHGFRAKTIYNGCDHHLFKPDSVQRIYTRSRLGLDKNEIAFGLVANFEPQKNHAHMIRALSSLLHKNIRFKAYFIGGAYGEKMVAYKNDLKKLVRHYQLQNSVFFINFQENISAFYNALDVVVFPFLDEGCCNALFEAMSCQKIIIANGSGSFPEIFTHGKEGLIVPPENLTALSESLQWVVKNKTAALAMGVKARKLIISRFSFDKMVHNYKTVFSKI